MKTYHYIVRGRVQGVFFRYHTKETADREKIVGTVKNLPNGDVEVYAQGSPSSLQRFEQYLHDGPPMGFVDGVQKNEIDIPDIFTDFSILH